MNWRKISQYTKSKWGRITLGVLPFLAVISLVFEPIKAMAFDIQATVFSAMNYVTGLVLQTLMNIVTDIIAPVIRGTLALSIIKPNFLLDHPTTDLFWWYMQQTANSIYLIALAMAAIAIIARLNVGTYNVKKVLGSFITAVVLTNLSLYIVRALMGINEALMQSIYAIVGERKLLTEFVITTNSELLAFFDGLINGIKFEPFTGLDTDDVTRRILLFAFAVMLLWFFAKIALLLTERIIRIFIAAITAPIIFASTILPSFQKAASNWWTGTIKWIIVLPVTIFILLVSLFFFEQAGFETLSDFTYGTLSTRLDLTAFKTITTDTLTHSLDATKPLTGGTPDTFTLIGYFWLTIAMFTLYLAGTVNSMLKLGSIMTGIVETPQKLFKPIQSFGNKLSSPTQKALNKWLDPRPRLASGIKGAYADMADKGGFIGNLEKKRGALTGVMGDLFNSKKWGEQKQKRREKGAESRDFAGSDDRTKQLEGQLDNLANRYHTGKKWADLTDEQKKKLSNKGFFGSTKRRIQALDDVTKAKKARKEKLTKGMTKDELIDTKLEDMLEDLHSNDPAKREKAATTIEKIMRNKDHPESYKAHEIAISGEGVNPDYQDRLRKSEGGIKPDQIPGMLAIYEMSSKKYTGLMEAAKKRLGRQQGKLGAATNGLTPADLKSLLTDSGNQALNNKVFSDITTADLATISTNPSTYNTLKNLPPNTSDAKKRQTLSQNGIRNVDTQNKMIALSKRNVTTDAIELRQKLVNTAAHNAPKNGQTLDELIVDIKADIEPARAEHLKMRLADMRLDQADRGRGQRLATTALSKSQAGDTPANRKALSDHSHNLYQQVQTMIDTPNINLKGNDKIDQNFALQSIKRTVQNTFGLNNLITKDWTVNDLMRHIRAAGKSLDGTVWKV